MTDIVGSTPLVCSLGDEDYQELIELHDRLLIESLQEHKGEYVRNQGDGALAAFRSARDAFVWSLGLQRIVPRRVGVQIRVGAHFGPIRLRQGGYVGKSLHVVARITALAGAGEVLASRPFLAASGPNCFGGGHRLVRLRGLDEVTEIFSIARAGRRAGQLLATA